MSEIDRGGAFDDGGIGLSVNTEIETLFVKNFIVSRMRSRLLFELTSPKKRRNAVGRFSHTADDLLIPHTIYRKDSKMKQSEILQAVSEITTIKADCYVMSYDSDLDACMLPLNNALNACIGRGMPSIVILNSKTVIIETEQSFGPAIKYILRAN